MINLENILIAFFAILAAISRIYSFVKFDEILNKLYVIDKDWWHGSGEPIGFFWVPKTNLRSYFRSALARNRILLNMRFEAGKFRDSGLINSVTIMSISSWISHLSLIVFAVLFVAYVFHL